MTALAKAVAKALHELAKDRGMTVRQFEGKTGLSKAYISKLESITDLPKGKRDDIASPTIPRLALYLDGFDETLSEFFAKIEPPKTKEVKPLHTKLHERLQRMLDKGAEAERRVASHFDELEIILRAVKADVAEELKPERTFRL